MMDLYYRLLNSGIALPLSAGSANGVKATPVGYDRVYVRRGPGAIDYATFMRALKEGRSFSTNGPILELEVDGRPGPGDRIDLQPGQEYRLRARARSRGVLETRRADRERRGRRRADGRGRGRAGAREVPALRSELVGGGARLRTRPASTSPGAPAGLVFAHTSPAYFLLGGEPVVVPESVRELLQRFDRLIAHTERLEGFRQESHRRETLEVYRAARAVVSQRLAER